VKMRHKINHGWFPPQPDLVVDDRYQAELERSRKRAEKAWRDAEKVLERAERVAERRPEPDTIRSRDEARMLVLHRLDELQQLHDMMREAPATGSKHSGRGSVSNVTSTRRLP
jgi:hypothetical protein